MPRPRRFASNAERQKVWLGDRAVLRRASLVPQGYSSVDFTKKKSGIGWTMWRICEQTL